MNNPNDDKTPSIDPIKAFFGPPPPRRPIPSYSFNTLVKIFSAFSDQNQNPFSEYASSANNEDLREYDGNQNSRKAPNSGDVQDSSIVARCENEASAELLVPASVEVCNLPLQSAENNGMVVDDLSINDNSSGPDIVMDELCEMTNSTKSMDKLASDEEGHDAQMAEVQNLPQALSGIERMIMDELDDMGLLGLSEKDVDFSFWNDFGSVDDTDVCVDNTVAAESSQPINLAIEGTIKEDVAVEVKRKDAEVNGSITESPVPESQACLPVDREISNQEEAKNQHPGPSREYSQNKDKRLCKEKDTKKQLELEGLTFTGQKSKNGGIVSIGNLVENVVQENRSNIATIGETLKANNTSLKDVKLGKHKHLSANGEALDSKRSAGADLLIQGKTVKQYARRSIRESSTGKVHKSQPESNKDFRYTREQLLHLRNVNVENGGVLKNMTFVSEDIVKAIQEISADLLGKDQLSAAGKTRDISGAKKEKQGSPTKAELAKENQMEPSDVKNKKRGSITEARKEKKKRLKRKKRAEMNKKLGVKRLKLKPDLKPKVVPPCRHYLNGRCQQGMTCKFSHDLIPLTKSKPCCHFARNACMKGSDCPFDHQLSKYPCKNYADTGFCIRGDSCSFSHQASATEGSKFITGSSKSETNSLLKLDESNSKHQLGLSTPNNLEGSAKQTSLPAIAPKGLSFLSFGKSSVENSAKHKEAELSEQRIGDAPRTVPSPNIAAGTASRRSDDGPITGSQLSQGISSRPVIGSQTKGSLAPISTKETDLSSTRPSYVSFGSKPLATIPTSEHTNSQVISNVLETANKPNKIDKLKAVVQPGSPTSSGQPSIKAGGAGSKPNSAQRALLSTLAFASKFESGIKMASVAPSKELNKDVKTSSDNEGRHNDPSKASAILDFLYSGGKK